MWPGWDGDTVGNGFSCVHMTMGAGTSLQLPFRGPRSGAFCGRVHCPAPWPEEAEARQGWRAHAQTAPSGENLLPGVSQGKSPGESRSPGGHEGGRGGGGDTLRPPHGCPAFPSVLESVKVKDRLAG